MSRRLLAILLLTLGIWQAPVFAALPPAVDGEPLPTLAPMLEEATPAVVNIATVTRVAARRNPLLDDPFFRRFFDVPAQPRERQVQSQGSGVVVDAARGLIVTNNHVIEHADRIQVTLNDGRQLEAEVVGTDGETDVAVIRVPAEQLIALPFADSDSVRVGDFVVAIGNPFGLGQTVTSGIVSALGRTGLGIQGYEDFIQTDASINPGNSGGALVNLRGELVGINTAIIAPGGGNVGIGFAVPANMVRALVEQLVTYGEIDRGQLGVTTQDLTAELAAAFGLTPHTGAVVTQVVGGSAADRAGLQPGDVVTAINGRAVTSSGQLRNAIGLLRVGTSVELDILRDGRALRISASISEAAVHALAGEAVHRRLSGARLQELAAGDPLYGRVAGVLVADVEPTSPAARSGLRAGDVITAINRQPVSSIADLSTLELATDQVLLNLIRGRGSLLLLLR